MFSLNPQGFFSKSIHSLSIKIFTLNIVFSATNQRPTNATTNTTNKLKAIKLSCISNEHSKTSIKCFKENENCNLLAVNDRFKNIKSSIMYECAFEAISIKAVKHLNSQEKCENNQNNTNNNANDTTIANDSSTLQETEVTKISSTLNRDTSSLCSKTSLHSQTILSDENLVTENTSFLPKATKPGAATKNNLNFKQHPEVKKSS